MMAQFAKELQREFLTIEGIRKVAEEFCGKCRKSCTEKLKEKCYKEFYDTVSYEVNQYVDKKWEEWENNGEVQ